MARRHSAHLSNNDPSDPGVSGRCPRQALSGLPSAFSRLPQAFAPLMEFLVSRYLTHVKEAGESPDAELLAPILAKFEEIKNNGGEQV
jgi:hypothetical protein